jgi:hypothetical protein
MINDMNVGWRCNCCFVTVFYIIPCCSCCCRATPHDYPNFNFNFNLILVQYQLSQQRQRQKLFYNTTTRQATQQHSNTATQQHSNTAAQHMTATAQQNHTYIDIVNVCIVGLILSFLFYKIYLIQYCRTPTLETTLV